MRSSLTLSQSWSDTAPSQFTCGDTSIESNQPLPPRQRALYQIDRVTGPPIPSRACPQGAAITLAGVDGRKKARESDEERASCPDSFAG